MANVAIVIPAYNARDHILGVLEAVPKEIAQVIVVDDCCPMACGCHVEENSNDPRVKVISHTQNQGVGGATLTGFKEAFKNPDINVAVKIDADGQIDPNYAPTVADLINADKCDYAKGSRFLESKNLKGMPKYRLVLNAILTFVTKFSSGYYSVTDPTNGLVAISRTTYEKLSTESISKRYFFESDMLHHLGLARARILDVSMQATYGDEVSGLSVRNEGLNFALGNLKNFASRIFYRHILQNFHLPALYLIFGTLLTMYGLMSGLITIISNLISKQAATAGEAILPSIILVVGINMIMQFLVLDVNDEPK